LPPIGRTLVAAAANVDGHDTAAALFERAESTYCSLVR